MPRKKKQKEKPEEKKETAQTIEQQPKTQEKPTIEEKLVETKSYDKQFKIFIIVMFSVLIVVFIAYSLNVKSQRFSYGGFDFEKTEQGKLTFYRTQVLSTSGSVIMDMFLRKNPRDLKDIPINGKIRLLGNILIASDLKCEASNIAGGELGLVLGTFAEVKAGTMNLTLAQEKKLPYAECNMTSEYGASVLLFKVGNKTEITQNKKYEDCYELTVKDCQVLEVAERFIIGIYAHSKGIDV